MADGRSSRQATLGNRRSLATPRPSSRQTDARPPSRLQAETPRRPRPSAAPSPAGSPLPGQPATSRPSSRQAAALPSARPSARAGAKAPSAALSAGRLIVGSEAPAAQEAGAQAAEGVAREGGGAAGPGEDPRAPAEGRPQRRSSGRRSQKEARKSAKPHEHEETAALSRRLFELADLNKSGSVQFHEFVCHHHTLINQLGDQLAKCDHWAKMSPKELEREFRKRDVDHSLYLDFDEYAEYMEGFHSLLGHRSFVQLCTRLLEDAAGAEGQRGEPAFDAVASDLLLDKLRGAGAATQHVFAAVEQLLGRRADPNSADAEGSSALLLATGLGGPELVARLLLARADPARANGRGDCPLLRAARDQDAELARALLAPAGGAAGGAAAAPAAEAEAQLAASARLLRAVPEATGEEVRELLAQRADVNRRDERGWTALISAVFWGRKECVEELLRHQQLNPNTVRLRMDGANKSGHSALHIAARKGRHELMPLLMSSRCCPDLPDCEGWTPLHHATFNGMDRAVQALAARHASVLVRGNSGFTPWMVSTLPTRAGKLSEATLKLLDPNEHVNFSKQVIPILGDASLKPYEKLQELYDLPGVAHVAANLRLYEHFFHVRSGPNRVRLTRMWDGLARELLLRLRSGQTDVAPRGALTEEQREEQARRWHDQKVFLRHWFRETRGPPPGHGWRHDSREAYRAELDAAVAAEMQGFRAELDGLYEALRGSAGAEALCAAPALEVLRPEYLSQLGAHPIPAWLEARDAAGALRALGEVHALGPGRDTLQRFLDLVAARPDLQSGEGFWSHIYKVWLQHYAQAAQLDFQHAVAAVAAAFNRLHGPDGLHAAVRPGPVKTYERMRAKEAELGAVSHATPDGRRVASQLLDVVRASLTVSCPRAAAMLLEDFFRPLEVKRDKLELVRVVNNFSAQASPRYGYRDLVLNLHCDCGVVGEVQLVLEDFLAVKKRMHLLTQYLSGEFDHRASSALEASEATRGLESED